MIVRPEKVGGAENVVFSTDFSLTIMSFKATTIDDYLFLKIILKSTIPAGIYFCLKKNNKKKSNFQTMKKM